MLLKHFILVGDTEQLPVFEMMLARGYDDLDESEKLKMVLTKNPGLAQIRSADGRGPLWWAYESGNSDIVKLLKMAGAREDARDANGVKPADVKP